MAAAGSYRHRIRLTGGLTAHPDHIVRSHTSAPESGAAHWVELGRTCRAGRSDGLPDRSGPGVTVARQDRGGDDAFEAVE